MCTNCLQAGAFSHIAQHNNEQSGHRLFRRVGLMEAEHFVCRLKPRRGPGPRIGPSRMEGILEPMQTFFDFCQGRIPLAVIKRCTVTFSNKLYLWLQSCSLISPFPPADFRGVYLPILI